MTSQQLSKARILNQQTTPQSTAVETAGTLGAMEMLNRLRDKFPGGGPKITGDVAGAAKNASRKAGSPGFFKSASKTLMRPRVGLPLAGLALLGSALNASEEFDNEDVGLDASQASGRFLADLGSTGGLAALGAVLAAPIGLAPVGAVALPAAASLIGVQDKLGKAGANIGGGLYSALTGIVGETDEEKNQRITFENEMNKAEILKRQTQLLAPVQDKLNEMQLEKKLRELEAVSQIQSRYNYRNSLDQQSLLNAQNSANLSNILASTLY